MHPIECPSDIVAHRHRGVRNASNAVRQMVSLNYSAGFLYDREVWTSGGEATDSEAIDRRLLFSADCAESFARPSQHGVRRNVRFVNGPVNHFENAFGPGGAAEGVPDHLWELRQPARL